MVSVVTEDDGRSDDYWMGVRDALRMVDSFLKWRQKNTSRAKTLEDFIHDGLIAAAKRCESCLSEKLGVRFDSQEPPTEPDELPSDFESTPTTLTDAAVDALSESPPEEATSYEDEIPAETEIPEEGMTVDSVERTTDELLEDVDIEGPARDFTSDFELVEPSPLVIDESEESVEPDESAWMTEDEEDDEPEEAQAPASFTWAEYEEAVTPSEETAEEEEEELEQDDEPDFLPEEPPDVWNPYDEPSISDEELSRETQDEPIPDADTLDDVEAGEDIEEASAAPPPPPPPPESDEDEEERKRRARRLFFGA